MTYFLDDNYLFAENIIIEKLTDTFKDDTEPVKVDTFSDIRLLLGGNYHFPSVLLFYIGDTPIVKTGQTNNVSNAKTLGNGKIAQVTQHWGVVLSAKDPTDPKNNSKVREKAGKLFLRVLKALQGLEISQYRHLYRVPFVGNTAMMADNGHLMLTAQFDVLLDVIGEN
jgi:hypothetical protein